MTTTRPSPSSSHSSSPLAGGRRDATEAPLAALFPGQGSQFPRMGVELRRHAHGERLLRRAEAASGLALSELVMTGSAAQLARPDVAQVVVVAHSLAVLAGLREAGVEPAVVAGHSVGEYSALVAAGMLDADEALDLVALRGRLMAEAAGAEAGTMAAIVGLDPGVVEELCASAARGPVVVANRNSPRQTVVSGAVAGVEEVCARASDAGAFRTRRLDVGAAYHSPLMAEADARMAERWRDVRLATPATTFVSSVGGDVVDDPGRQSDLMRHQLCAPVAWAAAMAAVVAAGARAALEAGPGRVLAGLCREQPTRLEVVRAERVRAERARAERVREGA